MRDVPKLLRSKEFNILKSALEHCKEYTIEMTMDGYSISASVQRAPAVWEQPMLIQVKQDYGNIYEIKNCRSIEELKWYLGGTV